MRFVVQEHTRGGAPAHWDLMLEQGDALETYRLDTPPERLALGGCLARKIADHPRRFLTYEGAVEGGAGRVRIVDSGFFEEQAPGSEKRVFSMRGKALRGLFSLVRAKDDAFRFECLTKPGGDSMRLA